ncbi:hypothetical protein AVEN_122380-1 [Araneus ventricosus]|uniref:Uncharacterized protein n=1 Tax=Araneus ventricosus TaxID=182803 RepID=A0A4Y2GEH7_ARAVE|nr:hypothetical protein AVEN_122380-1 [Araneus ventricosus]
MQQFPGSFNWSIDRRQMKRKEPSSIIYTEVSHLTAYVYSKPESDVCLSLQERKMPRPTSFVSHEPRWSGRRRRKSCGTARCCERMGFST